MNEEKVCTTSGKPIDENTRKINPETGMQNDYIVLCPDERAKGFVRPYRDSYRHTGVRPKFPLRDLTADELKDYTQFGYVKFEEYPEDLDSSITGRYWTEKQLNSGCRVVTTMNKAIAETYQRNPRFYSGTYCAGCKTHFPLEEFTWIEPDGSENGENLGD